ncbi:hypothetical protein SV7mr_30430 [Stieleria bergensis]|uniref:Uncharacterized protein n=2 Tax=Stieleria bergensis TaxID=2528025 RepID=A0A517SWM1_9BACT|nr:hypothetical protein SV7mr_30430 [Planctomycetes bacterium SV_7m_r]
MVHETKVGQRNGSQATVPKGLARNMGGLAHDLFTLTELHFALLSRDLRDGRSRMLLTGLLMFVSAVIGVACVPIALVSLAIFITDQFETSYALGFLLAALAAGALSGTLGVIGCFKFRGSAAVLQRSSQELTRNLRWIKTVLERDRDTKDDKQHSTFRGSGND